jgi:hypothetical protein
VADPSGAGPTSIAPNTAIAPIVTPDAIRIDGDVAMLQRYVSVTDFHPDQGIQFGCDLRSISLLSAVSR